MSEALPQSEAFPPGLNPETLYAHQVQMEWGRLLVTSEANESYELMPLIAGVEQLDGKPMSAIDSNEGMVITIAGWNETNGDSIVLPEEGNMTNATALISAVEKTFAITVALDQDPPGVQQDMANSFNEQGLDINELVDIDGIPFIEAVRMQTSQNIAHTLSYQVKFAVERVLTTEHEQRLNQEVDAMNRRNVIRSGIGGTVLASYAVLTELGGSPYLSIPGIGVAGAYLMAAMYRRGKFAMAEADAMRSNAERAILEGSVRVATSVHDIYCRHVMETKFNPDIDERM